MHGAPLMQLPLCPTPVPLYPLPRPVVGLIRVIFVLCIPPYLTLSRSLLARPLSRSYYRYHTLLLLCRCCRVSVCGRLRGGLRRLLGACLCPTRHELLLNTNCSDVATAAARHQHYQLLLLLSTN